MTYTLWVVWCAATLNHAPDCFSYEFREGYSTEERCEDGGKEAFSINRATREGPGEAIILDYWCEPSKAVTP